MAAEDILHLLLHTLGTLDALIFKVIHVADDDDGLQVGTVPVVEEVDNGLAFKVHDDLFFADGQTVGIERALQHDGPGLLAETVAVTSIAAPLFVDDTALTLKLFLVEEDIAGPTVEDFNTHLDHLGVVGGHVDVVDRLIERGVGVDVATELDTMFLQLVDHLVVGIALDAVEGHVLTEVGQTLLVVAFHDGTGVGDQAELNHVLGLLVITDVIGEAVVECAIEHLLVEGHLGGEVTFLLLGTAAGQLGEGHATEHEGQQHCE